MALIHNDDGSIILDESDWMSPYTPEEDSDEKNKAGEEKKERPLKAHERK